MTKYIHYTKLHSMGVLISDNVNESKNGYTLGLEIECDCFDSVLTYMMVNHRDHITLDGNLVTNENLNGFKNEFMRCMDVIGLFVNEAYKIRVIHENDTVTWYTKEVLPKI